MTYLLKPWLPTGYGKKSQIHLPLSVGPKTHRFTGQGNLLSIFMRKYKGSYYITGSRTERNVGII